MSRKLKLEDELSPDSGIDKVHSNGSNGNDNAGTRPFDAYSPEMQMHLLMQQLGGSGMSQRNTYPQSSTGMMSGQSGQSPPMSASSSSAASHMTTASSYSSSMSGRYPQGMVGADPSPLPSDLDYNNNGDLDYNNNNNGYMFYGAVAADGRGDNGRGGGGGGGAPGQRSLPPHMHPPPPTSGDAHYSAYDYSQNPNMRRGPPQSQTQQQQRQQSMAQGEDTNRYLMLTSNPTPSRPPNLPVFLSGMEAGDHKNISPETKPRLTPVNGPPNYRSGSNGHNGSPQGGPSLGQTLVNFFV
jgi:hypothetical protein